MANVFARIIAQGVVFGIGVLTKTFHQAYLKAQLQGAQAGKAVGKSRMPLDQARQILNFERNETVTMEKIAEQAAKYHTSNDPDKGGSFYIQAKVHFAREALIADLKRSSKEGGSGGEGGAAETKKQQRME
jgi:import inner membrane translocase subunit TIM16